MLDKTVVTFHADSKETKPCIYQNLPTSLQPGFKDAIFSYGMVAMHKFTHLPDSQSREHTSFLHGTYVTIIPRASQQWTLSTCLLRHTTRKVYHLEQPLLPSLLRVLAAGKTALLHLAYPPLNIAIPVRVKLLQTEFENGSLIKPPCLFCLYMAGKVSTQT